jgi:hypothetical protein
VREIFVCRDAHQFPFPAGITSADFEKIILHNAWEWHARLSDTAFLVNAFHRGVAEVMGYLDAAKAVIMHVNV